MTLHKLHIFGVNMCLLNAHICVICLSAFFFFISDGRVSGWSGLACQGLSYVSYIVSRSLCQLYFFQFVNCISFSLSTLFLSLYNSTVFPVGSERLDKLGQPVFLSVDQLNLLSVLKRNIDFLFFLQSLTTFSFLSETGRETGWIGLACQCPTAFNIICPTPFFFTNILQISNKYQNIKQIWPVNVRPLKVS